MLINLIGMVSTCHRKGFPHLPLLTKSWISGVILLGCLSANACFVPTLAHTPTPPANPTLTASIHVTEESLVPPTRFEHMLDKRRISMAQSMKDWVEAEMVKQDAEVAVIARRGLPLTKLVDDTGMAHTGIVLRDPLTREWTTYNLFSNPDTEHQTSKIWKTSLTDFFYGQRSDTPDALLMFPDKTVQNQMKLSFQSGSYRALFAAERYNLVTPTHTLKSLNCIKWVLLNLYAAKYKNYNPNSLITIVGQEFKPKPIRTSFISRWILRHRRNVIAEELPKSGPLKTVTVEGLYNSPLFKTRLYYKDRVIAHDSGL